MPKPSKTDMLHFHVPFSGKPDDKVKVTAYAFDSNGKLIASAPVEDERAQLPLTIEQARRARIFFGPSAPEGRKRQEPTLEMMKRGQAYEPVLKLDPDAEVQKVHPIPEPNWKWWLWCVCRVRGQVVRPINVGGTTQNLPVCHARVHICEVDSWPRFILRLPDSIIWRIRDEFLKAVRQPIHIPIPLPDPAPFKFDQSVIDRSPAAIAQMNRLTAESKESAGIRNFDVASLNPQPLPPRSAQMQRFISPGEAVGFNPQPDPPAERFVSLAEEVGFNPQPDPPLIIFASLPVKTQLAFTSSSAALLREELTANMELIRPFFCIWEWFWWWWTTYEYAVVETDEQGHFDWTIFYPCLGDHPDLYFWVEYCIGGTWTPVYSPSVPCHTYWNYACGTEVTISVTDPRVPPCAQIPDLPGLLVAILSIGNDVSMSEIQGAAAGSTEGLTTSGEPFGGTLEPHVGFSRTALFAQGITHYRWSYRRLTLSDGTTPISDSWHAMDRRVIRHYETLTTLSDGTVVLSFPTDQMGPDPAPPFAGQNLFRIQPIDAPAGALEWAPYVDAREDSATAFFETALLAGGNAEAGAGKYELKFELFKNDGSLVNFTDAGVGLDVANVPAPFGTNTVTTLPATNEHRILDGSGKTLGFRLVVRVDNNPCTAVIADASGSGLTIDVDCGFIQYAPGATVDLSFTARHPHNFATFNFTTYRGSSNPVPVADASGSVGASPINGFIRNASSVFTKSGISVPALTAPCTKAAFAENLYVWALATDGWYRLYYLDASAIPKAFALEPSP
jgi:hypothetical protein